MSIKKKYIYIYIYIATDNTFFPDVKICNVENPYQHFEQPATSISLWEKIYIKCAGSRFLQNTGICLQK